MPDERYISLETLAQGAAVELFNDELTRVLGNILDPNTKPTTTRSVTLTFTIKPDEDRSYAGALIDVKSKLAPVKGVGLPIHIGQRAGHPVATERDTRQLEFQDNVESIAGKAGK
jgi:hypothetical protein